jgi:hypothetical protein
MTFLNRNFPEAVPCIWSLAATFLAIGIGIYLPDVSGRVGGLPDKSSHTPDLTDSLLTSSPESRGEAASTTDDSPCTLDDAIKFARGSLDTLAGIADYTARFSKTELVENRVIEQAMHMKLRREPFSVYLRCCSKHESGREVIYVEGENKGCLLVHEGGIKAIAGTLNLEPSDPQVMDENRYPITMIGLEKMLATVVAIWDAEKEIDTADVAVKRIPDVNVGPNECAEIVVTHGRRVAGLKFHETHLYIDTATNLPVQVEQYGWPAAAGSDPPLIERYTYSDVQTQVGLTDADFDPHNANYRF